MEPAILVLFSANRAAFRCVAFRLEAHFDTVLFSEFMDTSADLSERPEVMQLLVPDFAMVRFVAYVFQVAYDEFCDMLIL
jgi:hypothetical protein